MMSAAQFSSKMLKNLKKNKAFVGRYDLLDGLFLQHLPTKLLHSNVSSMMSAAQFSSKKLKNLKEQGFCTKVLLAQRQLSEVFSCKDKLCSFCELSAWWKSTQTSLLTKMRDFENIETSKTWKFICYLFCEFLAWWKSTQTLLLTEVTNFERSQVSTTWKFKLYSFFQTAAWWKPFRFLFWQK